MPRAAIDCLQYVSTPEFIQRLDRAREGDRSCRFSQDRLLPCFSSIDRMVEQMDEAGIEKVFIAQAKMWSYWRKWMFMDTQVEEVLQYTERYPDRFVGLAGYDPYRISQSLGEVEFAVAECGFRGVYAHVYGFDVQLQGREMYPLYAKCVELNVPVYLELGQVMDCAPGDCARPMELDRIACDFPELKIVAGHAGWPWIEELIAVCTKWDNVWIAVNGLMPRTLPDELLQFMASSAGQNRCLWGTEGLPWAESLRQVDDLPLLSREAKHKLLNENASRLFRLNDAVDVAHEAEDREEALAAER